MVNHLRAVLEKKAMGAGVLEAKDIYATYKALKSKGIEFLQEPKEQSMVLKLFSVMVAAIGSA